MIRSAATADLDDIHRLDRESTNHHRRYDKDYYTISDESWQAKRESQMNALRSRTQRIIVAEENGKIAGYIWGSIRSIMGQKIGKIDELIVTSKHRRKGIGSDLIKGMIKYFKEKECVISEVEVFVKNVEAVGAYEKAGYNKREYKMHIKLKKNEKYQPFS
jgi:ribosomal protein S18 acetylase RimI-like enzyme